MTFQKEVPVGIGINTLSETGWWDCAKIVAGCGIEQTGLDSLIWFNSILGFIPCQNTRPGHQETKLTTTNTSNNE